MRKTKRNIFRRIEDDNRFWRNPRNERGDVHVCSQQRSGDRVWIFFDLRIFAKIENHQPIGGRPAKCRQFDGTDPLRPAVIVIVLSRKFFPGCKGFVPKVPHRIIPFG